MDELRQDNQLEPAYISVSIRDVPLRTRRKRWTIEKGGGRGSGISVLMIHDMMIYIYIYIYVVHSIGFQASLKLL